MKKGARVRLTLNLRSFQDILTAESEAVWVRADSTTWKVGLAFGSLNPAQERQLKGFEAGFSRVTG